MNTVKFDYPVDLSIDLLSTATAADNLLNDQCQRLVGGLRVKAAGASNAVLYAAARRAQQGLFQLKMLVALTGGDTSPFMPKYAETVIFAAVDVSTLAQRYVQNELEPQFHAFNEEGDQYAAQILEREKAQQPAPSNEDYFPKDQSAVVNGASDGIV